MPKFTAELIDYADSLKNLDINLKARQSIRGLSIDAEETKDIDDTIWVKKQNNTYICDVSIADTAEYVQPDSPVFEVASQNVVTKYLKDYSIQMIPAALSKGLLSLKQHYTRPAINFHIELDSQMNVIYFNISERKIRNTAKLSYQDVAKILTNKEEESQIREVLINAYELAVKLSTKRRLMGALAYFDEEKGLYTDEEGNIKIFANKNIAIAYMIVQELMVLANSETARYFAENDIPFVFRNHTVKGNIPDREEVHTQLVHALQNKAMFKSFVSRMNIWQNKAQYGTELSGHYALNLPAYAHVTSPIRRFADMLNHVIIKAHIHGKELPLSVEQIKEYCENINAHMLKEQKEKHEHFKQEAYQGISEKLESISSDDLLEMDSREFKQTIKSLREANQIKPMLGDEILRRVKSFNIASIDLYYLLFESQWMKEEPELREIILGNIRKKSGLSTELLTLMQAQKRIGSFTEVLGVEGDQFTAYCVIETSEDTFIRAEELVKSTSKKKVIEQSRRDALLAYLNGTAIGTGKPEVNPNVVLIPTQAKKESKSDNERSTKFSNPIGMIQEISAKRSDMSIIGYHIEQINDQPPRFECILKINYNGEEFEYQGEGDNKKSAKFEAAHKAAERFENLNISSKTSKTDQLKNLISEGLYLNALNFACTIENEDMPIYTFEEIGEGEKPEFICLASLKFKENNFSADTSAFSKKEAKSEAAKIILYSLLESYPEILGE